MTVALCNIFNWSNTTNDNISPKRKHTVNNDFCWFWECPKQAFCHKEDDHSWTCLLTEVLPCDWAFFSEICLHRDNNHMVFLNKTHVYIFQLATVQIRQQSGVTWPWRPRRLGSYDRTVVGWVQLEVFFCHVCRKDLPSLSTSPSTIQPVDTAETQVVHSHSLVCKYVR